MKTRAAIVWPDADTLIIEEISLDAPGPGEVLVRLAATAMCRSDHHVVVGGHRNSEFRGRST